MARTVAYARVSTDRQDVDNQEFELRRYIEKNNIECDEIITETVSGTVKLKDRKIGELLRGLRDGDTLIVAELSRLSRDMLTIASILQDALSRGVTLIAVKEGWTLGNDIGSKFTAVAFGMAAEVERNMISARTKEALARRKADGMVLGRPVGSTKPEWRKLYGKDDEIVQMLQARIPKSAIARWFKVSRPTVLNYINDNGLQYKALGLDDLLKAQIPDQTK